MSIIFNCGLSGGKDSSALGLWAVHESGIPKDQLSFTFADTGNEDDLTYEHLKLLNFYLLKWGCSPIEYLKPERSFFDLAAYKKRFPSRKAQFCTIDLKIKPLKDWLKRKWDEGHEVTILNGKRVNESAQRAITMKDQPERGFSDYWGCEEWMPLRNWTLKQVLEIHQRYGVPLNPLYDLGASRVGCFPCINCGKKEIRMVAKYRPEKIEFIAAKEQEIGSTFIQAKGLPKAYHDRTHIRKKDGKTFTTASISRVVEWSKTEHGGKQLRLELEEPKACFLKYHACE